MQAGSAQPYELMEEAALVIIGNVLQQEGSRSKLFADLLANSTHTHDAKDALNPLGLMDATRIWWTAAIGQQSLGIA